MNQDYNPKIYVLQLKELIYTAIFILLTIILIIIMVKLFVPNGDETPVNSNYSSNEEICHYEIKPMITNF